MPHVQVLTGCLEASSSEVDAARALLDEAELNRASQFRFERDRRRFVIRRARLRQVLARECDCHARELRFEANAFGKPKLVGTDLQFSASHSDERWLVALSQVPLGADCERVTPLTDWPNIAASLFGPGELAALRAQEAPLAPRAFFDCWARKEAFVKALGIGLSYPLDAFEVSVTPTAEILSGGIGWTIVSVPLGADYAGAVVAEGDGTPLEVTISECPEVSPLNAWAA